MHFDEPIYPHPHLFGKQVDRMMSLDIGCTLESQGREGIKNPTVQAAPRAMTLESLEMGPRHQ